MIFYLVLIIVVVLCLSRYKVGNIPSDAAYAVRSYIGILLLVLVAVLRFDVGYDYYQYFSKVYPYLDPGVERFELFSRYICYLAYYTKCPHLVFILFGLINYYCVFSTIKKYSIDFAIGILTFVAFFYLSDLSTIRQATAVSITFWGYNYIVNKKLIKYLITCVIASCFHSSAIFAIPIYFIYNMLNMKMSVLISVGITLGASLVISYLNQLSLYTQYLDELDSIGGGQMKRLMNIIWLLLAAFVNRYYNKGHKCEGLFNIIIMGVAFPFIFGAHLGMRIAQYFLVFFCLLIPQSFAYTRRSYKTLLGLVLVLYFMTTLIINNNSEGAQYIPYRCVLFENIDFPQFKR